MSFKFLSSIFVFIFSQSFHCWSMEADQSSSDIANNIPEISDLTVLGSSQAVTMNEFAETIDKPLITTGVVDCVVIAFYHPKKGVYLGHFLRQNQFFRKKKSGAC